MKRKRHIRPSFIIVTVGAAAALGGACSSSQITTNPPPNLVDASFDGPTVTCPATAPAIGDPCSGTGSCTIDGGTNSCGYEIGPTAECVDGKWKVSYPASGCNPGAPIDAGSDVAVTDAGDLDASDAGD